MGITNKQRDSMRDYLVDRLNSGIGGVRPVRLDLRGIGETDLILVGNRGIVIPVNRVFTGSKFQLLFNAALNEKEKVAVVFYKDGETFFRSAAANGAHFKDDKSLKRYDSSQINRMILTRPEEFFVSRMRQYVQYYQPASENLQEGIVSLKFAPVRLDYSHINPSVQYKPENRDSDKLRIWEERKENFGALSLNRDYVIRNEPQPVVQTAQSAQTSS